MRLKTWLRVAIRGTYLILHLLLGMLLCSVHRLRRGRCWHLSTAGKAFIQWWMQRLAHLLKLRITLYGKPLTGDVLYVANHISFLDIVVISASVPARFLAKHSVRYWPIVGYLTALSGSLFIRRGQRRELGRTLDTIKQALRDKRPVMIFPEGTTSLGAGVLKFHSGLFQAAIDAQVPVQPLTLHYRREQQPDRIAAYIDKDNLLINLLRLLARPDTEVHLSFTPPVDSHNHTRHSLATFCHARIQQNLAFQLQTSHLHPEIDAYPETTILGECE